MKTDMLTLHKNLFHDMSEEQINNAFAKLSANLPTLNRDQVAVRMMQITTLVRDGHSGLDVAMRAGTPSSDA